jgi:glycosyltransferase involved in cell wall biosynthesis
VRPKLTIITPSFNQGAFIERTIRSVLGQGYPALEYVVQDGASDDGTLAVLDAYRDRLAACVSEPDGGQADALNRAFARTGGEIMGWINSDDMLLPGALAAVARHFERNPETGQEIELQVEATANLSGFGRRVAPRVPPEGEVVTVAELVEAAE